MNHYVYMIRSVKKGNVKTYVGYTINLKNRLKMHNSGKGAKSTRGRKWKIIFKKAYKNKNLALKAEYYFKKNYIMRKKIIERYEFNLSR